MVVKALFPIYIVFFYGMVYFWRPLQVWRGMGLNPIRLYEEGTLPHFIDRLYRLIPLVGAGVAAAYVAGGPLYRVLGPIHWMGAPWISGLGLGLLLASLIWILLVQWTAGSMWSQEMGGAGPVRRAAAGFTRGTRHPVIWGMRFHLLGLFLLLPSAVTLATWTLGEVVLQLKVTLKENFHR